MRFSALITIFLILGSVQAQQPIKCPYAPDEPIRLVSKSFIDTQQAVILEVQYDVECNATITRNYYSPRKDEYVNYGYYSYAPGSQWYISNEFRVGYKDTGAGNYYVLPFESNHFVELGDDSLEIFCECELDGNKDLLWTLKANEVLTGICRVNKEKADCDQMAGIGSGALLTRGSVLVVKADSLLLEEFDFEQILPSNDDDTISE